MASNTVFVVNAFEDLKQKSSGGGGFSDGGVVSKSVDLKAAGENPVVVEIAPPLGVVYSGVGLGFDGPFEPGGVGVINFGPANDINIEEYFVQEDGTEALIGNVVLSALNISAVSGFFEAGAKLQYPNRLRYKLNPAQGPYPAGRVLLKYTLMEMDRPADQSL